MDQKQELRKYYLSQRKKLSDQQRKALSQNISNLFIENFINKGKTFHVFKSMKKFNEIDTSFIFDALFHNNKRVVVPKMKGKTLISCEITKQENFSDNEFGVEEPTHCEAINNKDIDIIIVPMLICDIKGMRLGYGGGYYDRFLSQLDVLKIGINFFAPLEDLLPSEDHDIPLNFLVTPNKVYNF